MKNSWKRVASGALALAIVASNVTANVEWGGLLDGSTITASAASLFNNNVTISLASNFTYDGSDHQLITNFSISEEYDDEYQLRIRVDKGDSRGAWKMPQASELNYQFAYTNAGTYKIYAAVQPKDNPTGFDSTQDGEFVGEVAIAQATPALVQENYTVLNDSPYSTEDQPLVTLKNNATSVVNVGTAQYAVGTHITGTSKIKDNESVYLSTDISDDLVGQVFVPENNNGLYFPEGYSVKVGETTYEPASNTGNIQYCKNGDNYALHGKNLNWVSDAYPGTNAFIITGVDTENKIIAGEFFNTDEIIEIDGNANYYISPDSWSEDIPEKKDAGEYPVFVKVDADAYNNNYSALAPTFLGTATITKATPTVAAKTTLEYDGTAQALVTASEGAGLEFATTQYNIIEGNGRDLSADDIKVNNVYKPTGSNGIYFPQGYSLKIKIGETETTYSNEDDYNSIQLYSSSNNFGVDYENPDLEVPSGTNALLITGIDGTTLEAEFVDASEYEITDASYSTEIPKATNAGTYTVFYKADGNNNYNALAQGSVDVTIAKADVQITEAPALAGTELDYTAKAQALITEGTVGTDPVTEQPQGTMKYAATAGRVPVYIESADQIVTYDVVVGDVFVPTSGNGIYLKSSTYKKFKIKGAETKYDLSAIGINIYKGTNSNNKLAITKYGSSYVFDGNYDGVRVDAVDGDTITFEPINKTNYENYDPFENVVWSTDIPKATDVGTYFVYFKVEATDNYNAVAPTLIGSTKIAYADTKVTLSNLDGDSDAKKAVITDADGQILTPDTTGIYTLTALETYYIYTEKTIAQSNDNDDLAMTHSSKTSDTTITVNAGAEVTYAHRYKITAPDVPNKDGYMLSHNNAWTGVVPTDNKSLLYVADGTPTVGDDTQLAAQMQSNATIYYGDEISTACVAITPAFSNIVKAENVSLQKLDGTPVTMGEGLEFGDYRLVAEISVDRDLDGFNSDSETAKTTTDQSITLYQNVTYAPRPMEKNDYFIKIDGKEYQLEVDEEAQTVTVPNTYWQKGEEISWTEPKGVDANDWTKKTLYTYDQQDHIPEIVVRNGGNNEIVLAEGIKGKCADTDAYFNNAKDEEGNYTEGAFTSAGRHHYELNNNPGNGNYLNYVDIWWTIAQADISEYITVAPNNNSAENDAIIYDGKKLDGDDFVVSRSAAYETADEATKALVDELIEGTKKEEAADQQTETGTAGATIVDSGTTVVSNVFKTTLVVTPAKVEKTTETEYEASDYTGAEGATITADNYTSFIGKIVNGNITVTAINAQDGYMNFSIGENAEHSTDVAGKSNINAESYNLVFSNNSLDCIIANIPLGVKAKDGYLLAIENIEIEDRSAMQMGKGYNITFKGVPAKKTTTSLADSNIKDASVEGEVKKANVTVKHNNFKDIEFTQTLTNDGEVVEGEDKSIPVTIAKRPVTITPKNVEDKPFVYGTYVGTSETDKAKFYEDYVTYDAEEQDDEKNTGLVTTDEDVDFSGAFKLVEPGDESDGFTFGDRWANQVDGGYTYELVEDYTGAPNYDVVIDENAEFVVTAKQITAAMFTLYTDEGLTTAYETAYKYNGEKQKVYVKGVDSVDSTVTFNASEFEEKTTGEGTDTTTTYELTKEGVTATADSVVENAQSNEHYLEILNNQNTGTENLVVSAGTNNIKKIVLTLKADSGITADNISQYLELPENATAELETSESGTTVVITLADNTKEATIAAGENKAIPVSKVDVTYTDVKTFENGTDFNVIGTTEGILPDTFLVGFKGVGNYAGTILDKLDEDLAKSGKQWEIKSVNLVSTFFAIATTTVQNETDTFRGYYYNGEAPEFSDDLNADDNKILYFSFNGHKINESDAIETALNTAKNNLAQAKQDNNEDNIAAYTADVEKYENLKAFITANPNFEPELTYYKLAKDTDTDVETFNDKKYVKLDEAPVDAGKYLVKATFRADGFTFNGYEKDEESAPFEIRTADYDLANNFRSFTYEKDYGELTVEDTTKPVLSFKVTEIFKDYFKKTQGLVREEEELSELTKAGYIPVYKSGSPSETTTDENGKIHVNVPVITGTVTVSFAGHLNGTYVNAGKYAYDTTDVKYGTVELIWDETGDNVEIGDFTPSNNYNVVWSSEYTVNKLKLTKEMFETVPVALVDGVADLKKAVKPSEAYAKLLRESDYAIVGAQTTANVGAVNVQVEAKENGNFTGVVKLQGEVENYGTNQVAARSATLGEELLLNIKFKLDETVTADADAYFEYEFNGVTTKVKVAEMTPDSVGRYVVSIPIVAKDAHKNVTVKLFNGGGNQIPLTDKEGNAVAETGYQYSIYEYFDLLINTYPAGNKYHEIGVAAKDYCIASNNALDKGSAGYNVSENVDLVDVNEIYNYAAVDSDLITGLDHVTSSVTCLSDNKLRVYFYFENGVDISDYTCKIDGVETELIKSSETKYYAEITNIAAKKLNVSYVFELKNNNTDETYTTKRSALTYSNILLTGSYKDTLKYVQFAKAFYNYNKAAIVAFGN